jgi:hypothetical protein
MFWKVGMRRTWLNMILIKIQVKSVLKKSLMLMGVLAFDTVAHLPNVFGDFKLQFIFQNHRRTPSGGKVKIQERGGKRKWK